MPSRDIHVDIDGDSRGFNQAARSAKAEAAKLKAELGKMEAKQKAQQTSMAKTAKSATLMRNELVQLAAAGATVAPAFVAASAGVSAFSALAIPAIKGVIEAQTKMAETWDGLSNEQKVSASGLRNLVTQYKNLAKVVEPEVLEAFNAGLSLTSSLMPHLAPLTTATANALKKFANEAQDALNSDRARSFFQFLENEAEPSLDAFGEAAGSLVGTVASLVQALAPLATSGVGLITMLSNLVGAITTVSPELAQLAVLFVALRGPVGSIGDAMVRTGGKFKAYSAASKGASGATKFLNLVTAAGPNLYVAAGLAIAYFGVKALTAKTSAQQLAEAINKGNNAVGNNIAGYRAANAALDRQLRPAADHAATATRNLAQEVNSTNIQLYQGAQAAQALRQEWVEQAKAENSTKIRNIAQAADLLGKRYDLTSDQAISLANAIGVDLSKGVVENGNLMASTTAKFDSYRLAVEAAKNPTAVVAQAWKDASNDALGLKARVDALTTAMDAYFNPALAVLQATNQMRDAVKASNKVLGDNKASLSDRQGALERQLSALGQMASAEFRQTQSVKKTSTALLAQAPALLRLAGNSKAGKSAIDGLIASLGGTITRTKNATIITDQFGNRVKVLPSGKVVKISAATKKANQDLEAVKNKHAALNGKTSTVTVKANTGPAFFSWQSMLSRIGATSVSIPVGIRAPGATGGLATHAGILPGYALGGGPVRGPGTGTSDSIPALLSDGEYVVNAKQTARHRALLYAINAGKFASGGPVGYASGGPVNDVDVPLSEYVSRFMDGKALSKNDYNKVIRSRKDAVEQLRKAERKLAEDRKKKRSAKTIADDEARIRKERRDLATATERLRDAEVRYNKAKLTPAARLSASLTLGIKNTSAFIKNITKLADMGFGPLAQQLLNMGGEEAEKFAASAVKLSKSKLKSLNSKVVAAQKNQTTLENLPNVLKVRDAQKHGATSVKAMMQYTGLSEEEIATALAAMGKVSGGIERYASGGRRLAPGIATRPTVLFGEGAGPEAFIPYDRRYRSKAMGLVNQVASDLGMTRAMPNSLGSVIVQHHYRVDVSGALDPISTAREVEKILSRLKRNNGRTQLAFS